MTDRDGFSSNALQILEARYFMKTETGEMLDKSPADLFSRVADFVATAEKTKKEQQTWSRRFLNLMRARDFLPNSPTLTGAGRGMCLSACFVLPVEDSMPSIFDAVKNTALVHKEGGPRAWPRARYPFSRSSTRPPRRSSREGPAGVPTWGSCGLIIRILKSSSP
jgi:ribonucleotide reductase alpha subunit